ncbi:MAG: hypothetical protein HN922_12245, partial [Anaerolineae bacterium]|nr:hypothetical protein [Anaerolineae bacterium]
IFSAATKAFENFITDLGHDMYFAEPLYYHNAIIFERYGFKYQTGKKLMTRIQDEFTQDTEVSRSLDAKSIFRHPDTKESIRLRSWAIHDGILGEPFSNVTMYKEVGKSAELNTAKGCRW